MTSPRAAFQFPVYQIDFTAVAAGKRLSATKRRIRWRFGFPNLEALSEGRTGTDCRGEEHEVVIVWSVTSGKRQILMDGQEVHYSATRTGVIDHSWSSKGNHIMKVIAHAAPPMSANPGFRQYDFLIDGQSFFTMPKVYELGVKGTGDFRMPGRNDYDDYTSPRSVATPGIKAPHNREEEDADLQAAIKASLNEAREHLQPRAAPDILAAPAPAPQEVDLFDVGGPPPAPYAPAPMPPPPSDTRSVTSYMSAPTQYAPASTFSSPPPQQPYPGSPPPQQQQPYPGAPPSYGVPNPPPSGSYLALPPSQPPQPAPAAYSATPPPPPQAHFFAGPTVSAPAPTTSYYGSEFAPAMHSNDDPFAPKPPTHNDIASEILKGYAGATPSSVHTTPGYRTPGMPGTPGEYTNGDTPQHTLAKAPLSMNATLALEDEQENLSELEKAMRKLVNVDHIDEPAEERIKLTMKQKETIDAKKNKGKSKPLPPAAHKMVGSNATLGQISEIKAKTASPKEGIMKAPPQPWHADAASAGMLVVHGLQSNSGPPPLQPRGFGVVHGQGSYAYGAAPQMYASPPPQQFQPPPQAYYQQPPPQAYYQQQQPPPPQGYPQYR